MDSVTVGPGASGFRVSLCTKCGNQKTFWLSREKIDWQNRAFAILFLTLFELLVIGLSSFEVIQKGHLQQHSTYRKQTLYVSYNPCFGTVQRLYSQLGRKRILFSK